MQLFFCHQNLVHWKMSYLISSRPGLTKIKTYCVTAFLAAKWIKLISHNKKLIFWTNKENTYLENGEWGWEIGRQFVVAGGFHLAEQRPVTGRGRRRRRPDPGRERRPQIRTVPLSVSQLWREKTVCVSSICSFLNLSFGLTWCSWSRKRFSSRWERSLASSSADCSAQRSSRRSAAWRSSSSHLSLMRSSCRKNDTFDAY